MSISLDQVTKRYEALPVVNDVSLDVAEGEFLVLLGPSGSGKSTLLRAIAGLIEVDHGRVSLHGRDVTGVSARQREVGFVFQHYALFRHMSVAENIEFALRVRRVRAAERLARRKELLRLVALEGMDDRLPGQLSGGQQQRVAVARALAHRPRVLLMDEPFGALDAKIREELRRTIRQIQRELGIATMLVTHDQEEAFALADRIGVMHQGRLLECGRPDDLYARPATRFVATFLGAANLLLGYRAGEKISFAAPSSVAGTPREVVAVLRPEEVELTTPGRPTSSTPVGSGRVEEIQFAGATERLRLRMTGEAPQPAVPDSGGDEKEWLLEVSRTLPEKRGLPLLTGAEVLVGARSIHVLPTPITSFTIVAADEAESRSLAESPFLDALAGRMHARVSIRLGQGQAAPPGLPVLRTGPGSVAAVRWQLAHGASQVLCLPPGAQAPARVVIHVQNPAARGATLAVAASLLRHLPAEAVYLAVRSAATPERNRPTAVRDLLDTRSSALAEHGLDMRTEVRFGDLCGELLAELAVEPNSMLVLGASPEAGAEPDLLAAVVEAVLALPVLVVGFLPEHSTTGSR
jgi:sulfate/thiosulfate transport system ATP-binding protein